LYRRTGPRIHCGRITEPTARAKRKNRDLGGRACDVGREAFVQTKNRGDVIGPPGVLRENRLETKIERKSETRRTACLRAKIERERQTTSAPLLHEKCHRSNTGGAVSSPRERERNSSRGRLSEPQTKPEMARKIKTRRHAARGKATEERQRGGGKFLRRRTPDEVSAVPWRGFPNTRPEAGRDEENQTKKPATQRALRDESSFGAPAVENRDARSTRSTAPTTRGGARRVFSDRWRRTLWAKPTSGKRTETQIQATRAAAHEEKTRERRKAARASAAALLKKQKSMEP
jgi:hypothetical protein